MAETYPTMKRSGETDMIALTLLDVLTVALEPGLPLPAYRNARREAVALARKCVRAAIAAGCRDDLAKSVEAMAPYRSSDYDVRVRANRYVPGFRG